ncbi:PKD domain-containing protein, partial [Aquisalimonas sp.]|uniref:PKD domain-containing protein n=1 Tax=Aquisalimonas sp. TaxID=1872621 RepID=UPI0025C2B359
MGVVRSRCDRKAGPLLRPRIAPQGVRLAAVLALLGLLLACNDPTPPPALEVAFFSFSVDGATVSFADASVPEPTAWQWDFAGLGTSSEQNPSFDFVGEGQYPVTLTVEFPSGNEESVERTVEITEDADDPGDAISVTVTPTTAMLAPGGTQEFQANVHGTTNTAVTWS